LLCREICKFGVLGYTEKKKKISTRLGFLKAYIELSGAWRVTLATTNHQQGVCEEGRVDPPDMAVSFPDGPLFRVVFLLPFLYL
jgi:hypothetical protein